MPYTPPGGDDKHSSMRGEVCEEACSQHKGKAQAAVLDTGFNGKGAAVSVGEFCNSCNAEAKGKCQEVMDEHHQEDVLHAEEERIYVA